MPVASQQPVQLCEQGTAPSGSSQVPDPNGPPELAEPPDPLELPDPLEPPDPPEPVGTPNEKHAPPICKQFRHICANEPHAVSEFPLAQAPSVSQQPGQLFGPHCCPLSGGAPHCWSKQTPLALRQFWQPAPEPPHWVFEMPCWHSPNESQQPDGHVWRLQTPASRAAPHFRLEHCVADCVQS